MSASRILGTLGAHVLLAVVPLCTAAAVSAQHPALAPSANTTIVVNGTVHYSSILVPAGVTVRFVAPGFGPLSVPGIPAVVVCDGDAIVHGTLFLAADIINDRPAGFVTTGLGSPGFWCQQLAWYMAPSGGQHAGTYGSVLPFSLDGGSPGGDLSTYGGPLCNQFVSRDTGGEGGGTLALLAAGRIEVYGTVTADGGGGPAGGSGGSILLRGGGGMIVLPGGTVTARGSPGTAPPPNPPQPISDGALGYVRLDSWGAPPVVMGTVVPPPTVLQLPYLRAQSPPRVGTTWILDAFAPENATVFFAASLTQGSGTPTPFGLLGLDLATTAPLAVVIAPPGHDPVASVPATIPNTPALVGMRVWVQALAVPTALPARLTNTLMVAVQ